MTTTRSTHLRRWGVVYFLSFIWLVFMATHAYLEWNVSQYPMQEDIPWHIEWLRSTFENVQSEVLQICIACVFVDAKFRQSSWYRAKEEE